MLFIDESGKPTIGREPTIFCLGAVACSPEVEKDYIIRADRLKSDFFGHVNITFHEPDMRRRQMPFDFGGDLHKQHQYDERLSALLAETDFHAFGVVIRKDGFEEQFLKSRINPYLPIDVYELAINLLMERYADFLNAATPRPLGQIIFESIGPREDAEHQFGFTRLLIDGTQWVSEAGFRKLLKCGCIFRPKSGSDVLELADLVSREIYEWAKGDFVGRPKFWESLQPKFYCRGDGSRGKFGLKVFPDSDIRETIEEHRERVRKTKSA